MNNISNYIAASPTGTAIISGNTIRRNNVKKNVKTSQQASAEANEKINKNEYVCDNIDLDKEDFTNCNTRYNVHTMFIFFIGLLLICLLIYTAYNSLF